MTKCKRSQEIRVCILCLEIWLSELSLFLYTSAVQSSIITMAGAGACYAACGEGSNGQQWMWELSIHTMHSADICTQRTYLFNSLYVFFLSHNLTHVQQFCQIGPNR